MRRVATGITPAALAIGIGTLLASVTIAGLGVWKLAELIRKAIP